MTRDGLSAQPVDPGRRKLTPDEIEKAHREIERQKQEIIDGARDEGRELTRGSGAGSTRPTRR